MSHPYDGCAECVEAMARRLRAAPEPTRSAHPAPTAAELERHAKRFGPEAVAETAAELGVDVAVAKPRRKRGARGPTLKERVAEHLAAGRGVELIAELENLSPSRARRIIEEVSHATP